MTKDVKKLGTILGVWAHPDDETFTSAGIMKTAIDNGQRVIIITATKGDAGNTADEIRWPKNNLGKIREKEQSACLDHIGIADLIWLDYTDGKLADSDGSEAINTIQSVIDRENVDTILTFDDDGITGHDDHKTVCKWAILASRNSSNKPTVYGAKLVCDNPEEKSKMIEYDKRFNLFFNTDYTDIITPPQADICLKLDRNLMACKLQCMRAHASQTEHFFNQPDGEEALMNITGIEAFIKIN